MSFEIIPTILTKDEQELKRKIELLEKKVERFQFDFIDGLFLPEKTAALEVLEEVKTSLKMDIHLMTVFPENWVEKAKIIGACRLIGQIERMGSCQEFISKTTKAGMEVGLGLLPETPVKQIESYLSKLDLVLVMTRQAGFGRFAFDEGNLEKVRKIRKLKGKSFNICVDGGIELENIKKCAQAGASSFAVGGAIWQAENIDKKIKELKREIER